MSIGERIKELRLKKGMTQEELGKKVGVQKQAIYKYEQGLVVNLKRDVVDKLAQALECSPAYLMCLDDPPVPPGCIPLPAMVTVPLVGQIACGTPITAEENKIKDISLPASWHADFALVCKGESMMPSIHNGDVVAIRIQPTVEQGQIAAVLIDGMESEATLKRVYLYPERLILQAENPAYPPIILEREQINTAHIEGKAVGLCRSI